MTKIAMITCVYNQPETLYPLFASFAETYKNYYGLEDANNYKKFHLFLHSDSPEVKAACDGIALSPSVKYYDYGKNRGLARSWNEGILAAYNTGADHIIIASNDVRFAPRTLYEMCRADALSVRDIGIITPLKQSGYSFFLLRKVAIERVGMFDENFYPAYYEDCDYAYRLKLAGLRTDDELEGLEVHHTPGGTIRNASQEFVKQTEAHFLRNQEYYRAKWGGGVFMQPDHEIFKIPFNNPLFARYYIAPATRSDPYPKAAKIRR